jgi:hypothetical protein
MPNTAGFAWGCCLSFAVLLAVVCLPLCAALVRFCDQGFLWHGAWLMLMVVLLFCLVLFVLFVLCSLPQVGGAIETAKPEAPVDVMMGIGGTPEVGGLQQGAKVPVLLLLTGQGCFVLHATMTLDSPVMCDSTKSNQHSRPRPL